MSDINALPDDQAAGDDTSVANEPQVFTSAEPAPVHPKQNLFDAIDTWFVDHFFNSVVSRNTDAFNHCQRAKEDLKQRIASL